jgi:hypothetical protein
MRHLRASKAKMQHVGKSQVVDETAAAGNKAPVLDTFDSGADEF